MAEPGRWLPEKLDRCLKHLIELEREEKEMTYAESARAACTLAAREEIKRFLSMPVTPIEEQAWIEKLIPPWDEFYDKFCVLLNANSAQEFRQRVNALSEYIPVRVRDILEILSLVVQARESARDARAAHANCIGVCLNGHLDITEMANLVGHYSQVGRSFHNHAMWLWRHAYARYCTQAARDPRGRRKEEGR